MISAATGAVALVIAPLMKSDGIDYFIAAVILAGIFQIILGVSGVAKLMRFIPRSVMVGFVNALAILIFISQVPEMLGVPWMVYPLVMGLTFTCLVFMAGSYFREPLSVGKRSGIALIFAGVATIATG